MALSASSRAAAVEILLHGAQSRAQLATKLGLSAPTLTRAVRPLLAAGVLQESAAVRTPGRGRSSLPLDVVPERSRFIGIKLTEESIYAVTTDLRAEVLGRQVARLESLLVDAVVAQVTRIVARLQEVSDQPVTAVGVTVGGRVDGGEVVAESPFLHWHEVPFRALLSQALGARVHLDNDVVGLTRAQHWFGHGRGFDDFALLTVGAGIGYGLVMNDTMVPTSTHPISHFPIDPSGPLCPLGHRGCATAYMSIPSMVAAASVGHRRALRYEEVLDLAQAGDPVAGRVVREAAVALGRTAAAISSLTGVQRIILSGEGVHLAAVAGTAVEEGLSDYGAAHEAPPQPVVRSMDFLEWARGAAVIAIHAEFPHGIIAGP